MTTKSIIFGLKDLRISSNGRVENEVVKDEQPKNFRRLHIQWWMPMKKGAENDRELYQDYWVNKWKCNLVDPKQWVDILSILFSFLARNIVTINSIIMISVNPTTKAKQNLDVVNETIKM
jgi:hypothetical protein